MNLGNVHDIVKNHEYGKCSWFSKIGKKFLKYKIKKQKIKTNK